MKRPQFQFTLRGMLVATLWAAISISAWTLDFERLYGPPASALIFYCIGLRVAGPLVTLGALLDNTAIGLWLAIATIAMFVGLLFWALIRSFATSGAPTFT